VADQVCISWSLDFNWTPLYIFIYLTTCVLNYDLCKTWLALEFPEHNYHVSWGINTHSPCTKIWHGKQEMHLPKSSIHPSTHLLQVWSAYISMSTLGKLQISCMERAVATFLHVRTARPACTFRDTDTCTYWITHVRINCILCNKREVYPS